MASLAELLAEEGFKRGKLKQGYGGPPASRTSSLPAYSSHNRTNSMDYRARRNRTRSDAFSRRSQSVLSSGSRQDRDQDLRRSVLQRKSSVNGYRRYSPEIRSFEIESYSGSHEIEEEFNERYHVSYPDSIVEELGEEVVSQEEENLYTERFQKTNSYKTRYSNELYEEEKVERNADNVESQPVYELKMDEIAVKAIISIVTRYIRRFFKDENFRASLYQNCASCLGTGGEYENDYRKDGVINNLKQVIRIIEGASKGSPSPQELKKAVLQLSVITGLSSEELKDGLSFGIPNLHLSACAHLYLGVINKFQKKDKASAEHLLQIFCICPNQARTTLLPGLWDRLFSSHLSHLKEWYYHETGVIARSASRMRKMKLLEEVYNDILDVGTYQFGVYYREWLMEGAEAPELPSIVAPRASYMGTPTEVSRSLGSDEFPSPGSSASSQATVSKKLYESVFRQSKKKIEVEVLVVEEIGEEGNNYPTYGSESLSQGDERTGADCTNVGGEHLQEEYCDSSADDIPTSDMQHADEWRANRNNGSCKLNLSNVRELKPSRPQDLHSYSKKNELTLKRLAKAAFQPQVADHRNNVDSVSLEQLQMNGTKRTGIVSSNSGIDSSLITPGTERFGSYEDIDQGSFFSTIPKDFVCPITGQLFQDPVTLESGQTYERAAIKEWFDQGNKTCPVTRQTLEIVATPVTNFVLKRVIDGWKSEHCRNLLFLATQIAGNVTTQEYKTKDESALFIIEQLLTGFGIEEQTQNARYLISLGGLQFLIRRLELGNLEEKTRVSALLLCCIKANGFCRNFLATNIGKPSILELLQCKQVNARTNAVSVLIELICLNRRIAINSFISGLQTEDFVNTMHVLLLYLQSIPPEERVIVAVLLLHFDLMVEPRRYSIYREETVDSIILALDLCLSDTKFVPNSRRALLMLGGHFSFSGEILTETWLLQQAGFCNDSGFDSFCYDVEVDNTISEEENEEEAKEKEEWLKSVALALLHSGKGSFMETLTECLGSGNTELVRTCLTTVTWLSHTLASLSFSETQTLVFLALIPRLKEILENSEQIEHRVLASLSLLNFSKISECRVLLMTFAEEIRDPLQDLVEVTWTSKYLYAAIFQEVQEPDSRE